MLFSNDKMPKLHQNYIKLKIEFSVPKHSPKIVQIYYYPTTKRKRGFVKGRPRKGSGKFLSPGCCFITVSSFRGGKKGLQFFLRTCLREKKMRRKVRIPLIFFTQAASAPLWWKVILFHWGKVACAYGFAGLAVICGKFKQKNIAWVVPLPVRGNHSGWRKWEGI